MIFDLDPNPDRLATARAAGVGSHYGTWPAMNPINTGVDYWADLSALLAPGATIGQINVELESNADVSPTIVAAGWDATHFCALISGGSDRDVATFTLQIISSDESRLSFEIAMPVRATTPGLVVNGGGLSALQAGPLGFVDVTSLPRHTQSWQATDVIIVLSLSGQPGGAALLSLAYPGTGPGDIVVGNDPRLGAALSINGTLGQGLSPNTFTFDENGFVDLINPALPPDGRTIVPVGGALSTASQSFVNVPDAGTILPTDRLLVGRDGSPFSTSVSNLNAEVAQATAPTITIDPVADQPNGVTIIITGELPGYRFQPALFYAVGGGAAQPLPYGSSVTVNAGTGTFVADIPGLAVARGVTVTISDAEGISATSNPFNVSGTVASQASLVGVPATGARGIALTGMSALLTPTIATAWVVLFGPNSFEGPRQACTETNFPVLIPLVGGNVPYKTNVFSAPQGGTKLFTSATIMVA